MVEKKHSDTTNLSIDPGMSAEAHPKINSILWNEFCDEFFVRSINEEISQVVTITGPTGSGKSWLAVELMLKICERLSVDLDERDFRAMNVFHTSELARKMSRCVRRGIPCIAIHESSLSMDSKEQNKNAVKEFMKMIVTVRALSPIKIFVLSQLQNQIPFRVKQVRSVRIDTLREERWKNTRYSLIPFFCFERENFNDIADVKLRVVPGLDVVLEKGSVLEKFYGRKKIRVKKIFWNPSFPRKYYSMLGRMDEQAKLRLYYSKKTDIWAVQKQARKQRRIRKIIRDLKKKSEVGQ